MGNLHSEFANTDSEAALEKLNSTLLGQNLSQIKFHIQPQHQKVKQAQQNLTKVPQNLQTFFSSVGINISPMKVVSHSSLTCGSMISKKSEKTSKYSNTLKHAVQKAINLKKMEFCQVSIRAKQKGISSVDLQEVNKVLY